MLILTRKPQQQIVIESPDGTITRVLVMGVTGNQVKIGVKASPETKVDREEIAKAKKESNHGE